jgi:hypothetical protein
LGEGGVNERKKVETGIKRGLSKVVMALWVIENGHKKGSQVVTACDKTGGGVIRVVGVVK